MPTFGYDSTTGWLPATYPAILADIQAKYIAQTTENTDVENGPAADMLRTLAVIMKDAWDDQAAAYNAGFIAAAPGTNGVAEGSSLELLLTPKIGPKLAATQSFVPLTLGGTPGTVIPAGQAVVLTGESVTWTLDAEAIIGGGGTVDGVFSYTLTGPKKAIAGSSWTIATPVPGWATVTNASDATPGRNDETDAEYRARYRQSLTNDVIAEVRKVAGVTSASIIEHPWGYPDAYWGLTHWFEVLVVGGADADVAAAIQRARANGASTAGNTSVGVPAPNYVSGFVTIKFSRPVSVLCWVSATITKGEDYSTDVSDEARIARENAIAAAVLAYFDTLAPGQDTSSFKIASYINNNAGVAGIDDILVRVDIGAPPLNVGTLSADIREQFVIIESNIAVLGA